MSKLIIAEKPSLARNIVAGIGKMKKEDGYFENDQYIVSWAFGHLFSLCDIERYPGAAAIDPKTGKTYWALEKLPFFPEQFKFDLRADKDGKVDAGVKKQYKTLTELMNRKDVDCIVNAGDADREGEIIVRLIIQHGLKSKKDLRRLWLPDQTPETVAAALKDLKPETEYDNLADEGFSRTYIDWLYGINLTRFASIKTRVFLRVGRVVVPIVKAIYDRDMEIKNFVPETYYAVASNEKTNGEEIELVSKNKYGKDEKADAQKYCDTLNAETAIVKDITSKTEKPSPGKLYSLSKLQNYLGKKYKMPMDESLEVIQKLYEDGYLTYPRTNSEYLATAEKDKVKDIIDILIKKGYPMVFKDKKTIFDDSKIESHSALTPTTKIPDPSKLSEKERVVYSAVIHRFMAVFCNEDCVVTKTDLTIGVGNVEDFVLHGTVIDQAGWTKYDDSIKITGKVLPKLKKGDVVNAVFKPAEKQTTPPKHYTIETLNNYLKNPFRDEKKNADEDDDEDYKAIFEGLELGTEATRTGIIDNAIRSKYIELKKDVYMILPSGEFLIQSLEKLGISMDKYKTSELGKALKSVYNGKMSIDDAVKLAETEIKEVFDNCPASVSFGVTPAMAADAIGNCPVCGKPVRKSKSNYYCTGYKDGCKFTLPLKLCGANLTAAAAKRLLTKGETNKMKFTSKAGKPFEAKLTVKDGKLEFQFEKK